MFLQILFDLLSVLPLCETAVILHVHIAKASTTFKKLANKSFLRFSFSRKINFNDEYCPSYGKLYPGAGKHVV